MGGGVSFFGVGVQGVFSRVARFDFYPEEPLVEGPQGDFLLLIFDDFFERYARLRDCF